MMRWMMSTMLLLGAAGCNVTVEGKLVDGISGEPIMGATAETPAGKELRVFFRAVATDTDGKTAPNPGSGAMCMVKEAIVAEDGGYTVPDLCASKTAYAIELSDRNMFLAETDSVEMGYEGGAPLELKVWRAPKGTGLFKLSGAELSRVDSSTELNSDFVLNTDEVVLSPKGIKGVPVIGAGEYLLLSGQMAAFEVTPLIASGKRRLGKEANSKSTWVDLQPWSYVGVEFTSDKAFERKTVTLDATKVITKEKGKRVAKYLASDVVPAGRYILHKDGAKRAWIVDFGVALSKPATK
jgi:hypothetical protein